MQSIIGTLGAFLLLIVATANTPTPFQYSIEKIIVESKKAK